MQTVFVADVDDELARLRRLEESSTRPGKELDEGYARVRPSVMYMYTYVALDFGLQWETVENAIAAIDEYHARTTAQARLFPHLAAVAAMSLAIKYTNIPNLKICALVRSCVFNLTRHPGSASTPWSCEINNKRVAAAEFIVFAALEWSMSSARASNFLRAFFLQGLDLGPETAKALSTEALLISKLAMLVGLSSVHRGSVLAAASIAAARRVLHMEPMASEELRARFNLDESAIASCVDEMTRAYHLPNQHMQVHEPGGVLEISPTGVLPAPGAPVEVAT